MNTVHDIIPRSDQFIELSKFVDKQNGPESSIELAVKKYLQEKNETEAIKKILSSVQVIFETDNDKDIEGFFCTFASFIESSGASAELVDDMLDIVGGSSDDKIYLRFTVLNHLYNIFTGIARSNILIGILKFALRTKQNDMILSLVESVEKRVEELKPSKETAREIYSYSYQLSQAYDDNLTNVLRVKFLETFNENDISDDINNVLVALINDPHMFQYETIYELPATQSLSNTIIKKVLEHLVFKTYVDYIEFGTSEASAMTAQGIKTDVVARKMRLLSLTTLASTCSTFKLSEAADVLKVDKSEVESWIVDAIVNGIIVARIDQLEESVYIKHCIQRVFTLDQWKDIAKNLTSWKTNIDSLLKDLNRVSPIEETETGE